MAANSTAKQPKHRISFAKLREPLQAPNLLGLQVESFDWLLGNDAWKARVEAAQASGQGDVPDVSGLEEIFHEISPIEDVAGTMSLSFHDHRLESPKYSMEEAKAKDYTYSAPMYVTAEFMNYETGEIKSQTVFMGDFPLMTPRGTFIINGTERVVVSQLVRSPGVYFEKLSDRSSDKETFGAKVIPSRGAWLEFEIDKRDAVGVRIDRKRKQSVTHFLKAVGMTESEIRETFAAYPVLLETLEKDTVATQEEALLDIYRKLRPGEPANVDAARRCSTTSTSTLVATTWQRSVATRSTRSWPSKPTPRPRPCPSRTSSPPSSTCSPSTRATRPSAAPEMANPSRSASRSTTSTTSRTVASAPLANSSRARSAPASPAWNAPCASA